MTTFTLEGNSNDTNLVVGSNYANISDGDNLQVATNATAIATNATDILDISNVKVPTLENKDKDLGKKDLEISRGLNSFFRFFTKDLDLSAGVLTSTNVYPPDLNNRANNVVNISLKQVTPSSGVAPAEITKEDYYKYATYATANLSEKLINVGGVDDLECPFTYGYNELFSNDPSNITGFNGNVGLKNIFNGIVFDQDMINGMGSQANCNGQAISNALALTDPNNSPPTLSGFLPTYSLGNKSFLESLHNDVGVFAPSALGPSFEKIDANGETWADRLIAWCGLSGEETTSDFDDVSFTKLTTNPSMASYMKFVFMMAKIYKLERLEQYGIIKMNADYICELLTRIGDTPIADLSDNGLLKYNQFPTWAQSIEVFKELVENLEAIDVSLNVNNINGLVTFSPAFKNILAPYDPTGTPFHPVGVILRIYMFHIGSMLAMCHNNANTAYVEPMKNLTYHVWDSSNVVHDISCGIDCTTNSELPAILAGVPIFQDLWFKLKNTYVLNNGIHLGGSKVPLIDTLLGQSLINMYAKVYQNIVDQNTDPKVGTLMTLSEFYNATFMTEFVSQLAGASTCYRTKSPAAGGAFGGNTLTTDQMIYLAATTNSINYKLISELYRLSNNNLNYKFYGTFGNEVGVFENGMGVKGNFNDFVAASLVEGKNVVMPSPEGCGCVPIS